MTTQSAKTLNLGKFQFMLKREFWCPARRHDGRRLRRLGVSGGPLYTGGHGFALTGVGVGFGD